MVGTALAQSSSTTLIDRWANGPCFAVDVEGNYAYFGNGGYLEVADISDPANPVELGKVVLPSVVYGVAVSGSYAYVADSYDGLRIIDLSTLSSPQEVGFFDTGSWAEGVAVTGSYAYVADGADGLYIIRNDLILSTKDEDLSLPKSLTLHQNYPNPFNPVSTIRYDLPQGSDGSLIVYDILGREVVRLVDSNMEPGYHQTQWNGRDRSGRSVPSGIYIACLTTPEYAKSIKMLLLK